MFCAGLFLCGLPYVFRTFQRRKRENLRHEGGGGEGGRRLKSHHDVHGLVNESFFLIEICPFVKLRVILGALHLLDRSYGLSVMVELKRLFL